MKYKIMRFIFYTMSYFIAFIMICNRNTVFMNTQRLSLTSLSNSMAYIKVPLLSTLVCIPDLH